MLLTRRQIGKTRILKMSAWISIISLVLIILLRAVAPGIYMRKNIPVGKEKDYTPSSKEKLQHILMG
jgi:hypothetical protein